MFDELNGKVVLITSTGIAAAAARAFGRLGAHVVVHYNKSRPAVEGVAADIESTGGSVAPVHGAFLFLATDEFSAYVTEQIIGVSGRQIMP